MAFKLYRGRTKTVWLPVTTSTAFTRDTLVEMTSGLVGVADDNDTALAGVIKKTIASTDADYATARRVPVLVPIERHTVWEADVTGTFTAADIGIEYGIDSAGTVDQSDTTNDVFLVTEVLSNGKIRGYLKINGSY